MLNAWANSHYVACNSLKVVCHLPANSHYIFPRIGGSHCFHLWDAIKVVSELEIIIFRLKSFLFSDTYSNYN